MQNSGLMGVKKCYNCGGLFDMRNMTRYESEGRSAPEFLCLHCKRLGIDVVGNSYKKRCD